MWELVVRVNGKPKFIIREAWPRKTREVVEMRWRSPGAVVSDGAEFLALLKKQARLPCEWGFFSGRASPPVVTKNFQKNTCGIFGVCYVLRSIRPDWAMVSGSLRATDN
jgi:hypothetical protein